MTTSTSSDSIASTPQGSSTRPYLIRALHEWCTDNRLTPYIATHVSQRVQVPSEYVKDGEIVLNVGFDATSDLHLGNDVITFKARFSGRVREIMIPVDHVVAIYARENGQGMAFPAPILDESTAVTPAASIATLAKTPQPATTDKTPPPPPKPPAGGRPKLKVIK